MGGKEGNHAWRVVGQPPTSEIAPDDTAQILLRRFNGVINKASCSLSGRGHVKLAVSSSAPVVNSNICPTSGEQLRIRRQKRRTKMAPAWVPSPVPLMILADRVYDLL